MQLERPSLFFSVAEPVPAHVPGLAPGPEPVPQPEPPPTRRPNFRQRWVMLAALAVFLIAGIVVLGRTSAARRGPAANQAARTASVERKDFIHSVRVHAIVEAVESHTIAAPRLSGQGLNTLIITRLVKNGSTVHQGDVLVEF